MLCSQWPERRWKRWGTRSSTASEPTLVGGDDVLDAAVRDVLGPGRGHRRGGGRRGVSGPRSAAALPAGVRLRGLAFTGPTPTPANAAAAIRAAVCAGGAVDVVAHLASDAQAARLLRAALRRTEAELARLRAAQRENAHRRAAQGVPKARIARDLGVQRVTVDAWLRTPHAAAPAPPPPAPTGPPAAVSPSLPSEPVPRTRPPLPRIPRMPRTPPRLRGPAAPVEPHPRRPADPRCCGSTRTPCGCNAGPTIPVDGWCTPPTPTAQRS